MLSVARVFLRWRSAAPWRWAILLAAIALMLYQALVLAALWWHGTHDERRPVEAIIVLGAAQWNGQPSPVLQARLDHALELYREGYAPRLLVTGGVGEGDQWSEAAVAAAYLQEQGVPAEAILVEDRGRSSLESIQGAAAILSARGLSRVLLVSDPPHMLRVLHMAGAAGLEAYGSPVPASPAMSSPPAKARFVLREALLYESYQWHSVLPWLAALRGPAPAS